MENFFVRRKDKKTVAVAFPKRQIINHMGLSGLKYYLIVMYLRRHFDVFGEVTLSFDKLLSECGYSTKSHNKSIYTDFREIIKREIIDTGYATSSDDVITISPTKVFSLYLNENKNLFYSKDGFVLMDMEEYEKILKINDSSVSKSVLVGVYLFIKQFISINSDFGSKISYPSKRQISNGIGIASVKTIDKAISALVEAGLLYVRGDMCLEDINNKGQYVPTRNVYALNSGDLSEDIVKIELEAFYKKPIYNKKDMEGNIKYLKR